MIYACLLFSEASRWSTLSTVLEESTYDSIGTHHEVDRPPKSRLNLHLIYDLWKLDYKPLVGATNLNIE